LKLFITILLAVLPLFSQMSVGDAWMQVKRHSKALSASHDDLKRAKLKQRSAKSLYLPALSVTASYTHLSEPIGIDISDISTKVNPIITAIGGKAIPSELDFLGQDIALADLQLLYPLYTGGKIDAAQDIYSSKVDESLAMRHMQKDKLFLKFIKVYYGVVMMESLYRTKKEQRRSLALHYSNAKRLKEQGQISRVELLDAKVKLNSAEIELTKTKQQLEIVKEVLYDMTKRKDRPKSPLFVSKKMMNEARYSENARENYAAIELLDAKLQQASAAVDIERSAWHPQVLGYANTNLYKGDSPLEELAPKWAVGVVVKFDLFSRRDRSSEVEAAQLLHHKVESLKLQAQEDLRIGIKKRYDEMMLYRDEFLSLSASLELAKENYKLRTIAFAEGLSTSLEVVEAQMFLSGARTKRLNAAYNYIQMLSRLCVLSGDSALFFEFERSGERVE